MYHSSSTDMASFPLVLFHVKLFSKFSLNLLIILASEKMQLTGNKWFSKNREKKFTYLSAVTFALLSCWCISSKFFLSVTRLDITQKLPSALGGFSVSWGNFLWAFPNSTKVRRGICAHVLGLQIRSLPYHDTPKICCKNSSSAGLNT